MATLEDILSDEPTQNEPIEAQEPEGQPRDESGRFAPKGESQEADGGVSPAPVEKQESELDHPALIGERRRRQEAEARIAEFERREAARANPHEPIPSVFEDEQGFQQRFGQEVVSAAVQQASLNSTLNMSEMLVRQANPDFEDMKATFLELAQANPGIVQQVMADPHPWQKAYTIAKNHQSMTQLGAVDVTDLEAKMREKIMAEMQANRPASPNIPESLASAQSSRTASGQSGFVPKTLEQILGG